MLGKEKQNLVKVSRPLLRAAPQRRLHLSPGPLPARQAEQAPSACPLPPSSPLHPTSLASPCLPCCRPMACDDAHIRRRPTSSARYGRVPLGRHAAPPLSAGNWAVSMRLHNVPCTGGACHRIGCASPCRRCPQALQFTKQQGRRHGRLTGWLDARVAQVADLGASVDRLNKDKVGLRHPWAKALQRMHVRHTCVCRGRIAVALGAVGVRREGGGFHSHGGGASACYSTGKSP